MERKLLLRLEKQDSYWRMDQETFFRFMSYVFFYFRICDPNIVLEYEDIQYVDISYNDMNLTDIFFGSNSSNNDTLLLTPSYPEFGVMHWLWKKNFTLYICEKKEERYSTRLIFMKANNR